MNLKFITLLLLLVLMGSIQIFAQANIYNGVIYKTAEDANRQRQIDTNGQAPEPLPKPFKTNGPSNDISPLDAGGGIRPTHQLDRRPA
jgi:hypothetical protein